MSAPMSLRARNAAATLLYSVMPEREERPLAEPPPGSGLKPVMGDPGLPFLGHTLGAMADGLEMSRTGYARFGPISWTNVIGLQIVSVIGPDGIETVLANRDKAFSNAEGWEVFIGPFFERGVMLMDFEEHHHHRRIMQQAFKRDRLVTYLEMMNPAIARGIGAWRPGQIDMFPALKQLTLDIATEVFMGSELGPEADQVNQDFINLVVGGNTPIRADVPGGRWHRGLQSRKRMEEFFLRQIPAKRAGDGNDLFSVLCHAESEDGERFSDRDVVNHMIFTMMAAHDTSTITAAMMAYFLAKYPEWQERIRAESLALGKPTLDYEDVDALLSMDLAFRETLRMNPPVAMLGRMAVKDTEIYGRYIPKGTLIALGMYASHRMEPFWNDPDTFDPERFTPERAEDKSHKYAWTPFGGNVHKCIGLHFGGMEVKSLMHQLLLKYELRIDPGYEPVIDMATGPFPADGLPIELRPR
ncbi:MAG: cytochrome P450 [Solirubrobacteraceae bacterium]|nr:cytochrome P450 [Solirubrobacteraceae bacterium]